MPTRTPSAVSPSSSCSSLPPVLPQVAHSPRPREGCARAARCRAACARAHRRPARRRWSPPPLRPKRGVVTVVHSLRRRAETLGRDSGTRKSDLRTPRCDCTPPGTSNIQRMPIGYPRLTSRRIEFCPTTGYDGFPWPRRRRCSLISTSQSKARAASSATVPTHPGTSTRSSSNAFR